MKLAQCAALELIHGDSFMPAAEPHIVAHFVPLSVIMSDHGGDLASYMAASEVPGCLSGYVGAGETLQNGMVAEVIEQAQIEQAVAAAMS